MRRIVKVYSLLNIIFSRVLENVGINLIGLLNPDFLEFY